METKICKRCNEELPLTAEHFFKNGYQPVTNKQKWKPTCKSCDLHDRKDRNMVIIREVFPVLECSECGYDKHFCALDFHHKDPSEKDYGIAAMLSGTFSKAKLIKELEKCVILCSNCHRVEHAKE